MGDSTMDMRITESSPSRGLWPVTEDTLLDEIFQTNRNCSEFGKALPSWLWARGTSPVRKNRGTALCSPQQWQLQVQKETEPGLGQGHHIFQSGTDQGTKSELQWGSQTQGQERGWGPRWDQSWALRPQRGPGPWHRHTVRAERFSLETRRNLFTGRAVKQWDRSPRQPVPALCRFPKVRINSWASWYNHTADPVQKRRCLPV